MTSCKLQDEAREVTRIPETSSGQAFCEQRQKLIQYYTPLKNRCIGLLVKRCTRSQGEINDSGLNLTFFLLGRGGWVEVLTVRSKLNSLTRCDLMPFQASEKKSEANMASPYEVCVSLSSTRNTSIKSRSSCWCLMCSISDEKQENQKWDCGSRRVVRSSIERNFTS
jgi:hypothetical protein